MPNRFTHKSNKTKVGLPPGTIDYVGEIRDSSVTITLINYNETEYFEKDFYEFKECMTHINPQRITWINIDGVHDTKLIETIGQAYNIHPLTLEDIANTDQRPKIEEFENYIVSFMKMFYFRDKKIHQEQLGILLLENLVITFQEPNGGDAFDIIRTRLRTAKGRVRKSGADYLAYALMDAVVDCYFGVIENCSERLEVLEEELLNGSSRQQLLQLYELKRQIISLRKQIWPMRDIVNTIIRFENSLIKQDIVIYLRDLNDHIIRIIDTIESQRDLASSVLDLYLSTQSNKMNEVMKFLTVVSTIFIPATFVAGVYGMNFDNMPEIHSKNGYYVILGIMLVIIVAPLIYFKRKRWI
jgi:magnesium transporter